MCCPQASSRYALLDRTATGGYPPKPASTYRLVGTSPPRLDLPDKLTGRPQYTHDLSPDGLCYGRIVRPPSRGATLARLDPAAALALPGVLMVVRPSGARIWPSAMVSLSSGTPSLAAAAAR